MTTPAFFKQLGIFLGLWLPIVAALHLKVAVFAPHLALSLLSLGFMLLACLALFFLGRRAALQEDPLRFNNFFLAATVFKMALSLLLLGGYWWLNWPEDEAVILLFFAPYAWFTVFEIRFLSQLARVQSE